MEHLLGAKHCHKRCRHSEEQSKRKGRRTHLATIYKKHHKCDHAMEGKEMVYGRMMGNMMRMEVVGDF